MFKAQLPKI